MEIKLPYFLSITTLIKEFRLNSLGLHVFIKKLYQVIALQILFPLYKKGFRLLPFIEVDFADTLLCKFNPFPSSRIYFNLYNR